MNPPTPTELDAAIERLERTEAALYTDGSTRMVIRETDLRLVLTALRDARKDGERLDWLENNRFSAYAASDPETSMIEHFVVVDETITPRRGNVESTIRAAIDSAMSARSDEKGRKA